MYLNAKALVQVQIIDGKIDPRRLTIRKTIWITIKSKILKIDNKKDKKKDNKKQNSRDKRKTKYLD